MKLITKMTALKVGDKIYAPVLDKYFIIKEYGYSDIYKDYNANLIPSKENPEEHGFTINLESIIKLGYYSM